MDQISHHFDDTLVIPSLMRQAGLFEESTEQTSDIRFSMEDLDIHEYDHIVLCMSGGKDSIACLVRLIEMGVDRSKLELWHHNVDGSPDEPVFFDWSFMHSYNVKLSKQFQIPLYFSWLEGGMKGEALKNNSYSKPHWVETPDGLVMLARDESRTSPATRMMFPQAAASLQTRWCSSSLKIDLGRRALTNQSRFDGKKTLFITGERREESAGRSRYNQFEPHAVDRRAGRKGRHVDTWRAVLHWTEKQVWESLERHGILAPVPYRLNWSRSSCKACIFNSPAIWATIDKHYPETTSEIAGMEELFGKTISRKKINVIEVGKTAKPFEITDMIALAQSKQREYTLPIVANAQNPWFLPPGAFGKEGCGSV